MADGGTDKFPYAHVYLQDAFERIRKSPFGRSHKGRHIVISIKTCLDNNKISFADLDSGDDDRRGDELQGEIRINSRFYGKVLGTVIELVHEGTHAYNFFHHFPRFKYGDGVKSGWQTPAEMQADEAAAKQNQQEVYLWMLSQSPDWPRDPEIDMRMRLLQRSLP